MSDTATQINEVSERLELIKMLFSQIQLLFDQVKETSEDNTKAVEEAGDAITTLITTIGNSPANILAVSGRIEDKVKDLTRDHVSMRDKLQAIEDIENEIKNLTMAQCGTSDKMAGFETNINKKIDDFETKMIAKLGWLEKIEASLTKFNTTMWKLIISTVIAFTLGMVVIASITYLGYMLQDLSKVVQTLKKVK